MTETETGRHYAFDYQAANHTVTSWFVRFSIIAKEALTAHVAWEAMWPVQAERTGCIAGGVHVAEFDRVLPRPGMAGIYWTPRPDRVHLAGGVGPLPDPERGTPRAETRNQTFHLAAGEELLVEVATAWQWAIRPPETATLRINVSVDGATYLVPTGASPGGARAFACGVGWPEEVGYSTDAYLGPVIAAVQQEWNLTTRRASTLVYADAQSTHETQKVQVTFLDESYESPTHLVRSLGEGGSMSVALQHYAGRSEHSLRWFMADVHWPALLEAAP